jgi:VIT family
MTGEILLEKYHIANHAHDEINELYQLLPLIGIDHDTNHELQDLLIQHYTDHKGALLKVMKTLEFGIIEEEVRSPIMAGLVSCSLYLTGSIPSILPYIYIVIMYDRNDRNSTNSDDHDRKMAYCALLFSTAFTTLSLLLVGAIKTWYGADFITIVCNMSLVSFYLLDILLTTFSFSCVLFLLFLLSC